MQKAKQEKELQERARAKIEAFEQEKRDEMDFEKKGGDEVDVERLHWELIKRQAEQWGEGEGQEAEKYHFQGSAQYEVKGFGRGIFVDREKQGRKNQDRDDWDLDDEIEKEKKD